MASRVTTRTGVGPPRLDHGPVLLGFVHPEEGLLDQVLGLGDTSRHPVGDGEEERAQLGLGLGGVGGLAHIACDGSALPIVTADRCHRAGADFV